MTEKKTNVITIDDTEYNVDEFTNVQRALLAHVNDLERKISNTRFQLDQLTVGRDAFISQLHSQLNPASEPEAVETAV
jgi:wobble nucleotide-excising tRNase